MDTSGHGKGQAGHGKGQAGHGKGHAGHGKGHAGHGKGHAGHGIEGDPRSPLVHRFDASKAEDWAKRFESPQRDAYQQPAKLIAAMQLKPGMRVADVGAGTGYFLPHLSKAVANTGVVVAVDIAPNMVRYMKRRCQREGLSNVHLRLALLDDPLIAPASQDRILLVNTWHHIAQRARYAAKLLAALKPGGQLFVVDFKPASKKGPPKKHKLSATAVSSDLQAGGFKTLQSDRALLQEQYVVVATKAKPGA